MTEKYESVFEQMKTEFFGIEPQIEQILKSIEAWETTKDYIVRPNILNVVGLTGVGKTAVINRIIELLTLKEKTVYFKFNNKTTDVTESLKSNNISDSIFIFDEFQYLRTKNENGDEIRDSDEKGFNIIWDLFDSGEVVLQRNTSGYFGLYRILLLLDDFIKFEVEYSKGVFSSPNMEYLIKKHRMDIESVGRIKTIKDSIESGLYSSDYNPRKGYNNDYYSTRIARAENNQESISPKNVSLSSILSSSGDIRDEEYDPNSEENLPSKYEMSLNNFLPVNYQTIVDSVKILTDKYSLNSEFELKQLLFNLNSIEELYDFFKQFENSKPMPLIKNFKNSFIITLSNIDEAYEIANHVGSDLDADYFHKFTSNVSIVKIREALLHRFRAEQIARFGSNYVLYPSLNKKSFEKIIEKELTSFEKMVKTKFSGENDTVKVTEVSFTNKIQELIYLEGVFPTIGARCVFSTVSEIVSEKLSKIIMTLLHAKVSHSNIRVEFDYKKRGSLVIINYYDADTNEFISKEEIKYLVKVDNLRKEKKENIGKQAHRGVHEAGHAVCSVVLMNILPEVIYSTVMGSSGAFNMFTENDFYYDRKNTYLKHIATLMAGYVAESIIFGDEFVSSGSSSDLAKATNKLSSLYKDCGFGNKMGRFVSQQMPSAAFEDRNYSIVDNNEFDILISQKISEACDLAKETLIKQKDLLMKLAEYLIKTPKMGKSKIKEYVTKYVIDYDLANLEINPTIFYLDMVNSELKNLNNVKEVAVSKN